jgi:hypothetical protein
LFALTRILQYPEHEFIVRDEVEGREP